MRYKLICETTNYVLSAGSTKEEVISNITKYEEELEPKLRAALEQQLWCINSYFAGGIEEFKTNYENYNIEGDIVKGLMKNYF